jgi:hypothetical protein
MMNAKDQNSDVLAHLIAYEASSTSDSKLETIAAINRVCDDALLVLDKIYANERMPLSRPSDDLVAELTRQVVAAYAAAGMSVPLKH